jgi:hypothetical protein
MNCTQCGQDIAPGTYYREYQGKPYCGDKCVCEAVGAEIRKVGEE